MAHDHAHIDPESGDRRVSLAIWANALLTVVQIVGGVFAGSLALIADALHNFRTWPHWSSLLSPAKLHGGRQMRG